MPPPFTLDTVRAALRAPFLRVVLSVERRGPVTVYAFPTREVHLGPDGGCRHRYTPRDAPLPREVVIPREAAELLLARELAEALGV